MAKEINWIRTALWETAKFLLRIALLIGIPQLVKYLTGLEGNWQLALDVLSVMLPAIDKWIHEDARIPAKGLLPF
jgi:hypothetical protein